MSALGRKQSFIVHLIRTDYNKLGKSPEIRQLKWSPYWIKLGGN